MKKFDIPEEYQSSFIKKIKQIRKEKDPKKKDFSPTRLNFGALEIIMARHFGFCYGVENAIEISYKAVRENPEKNIYLLSQMIHNPHVNADLLSKGITFIMDTEGKQLIPWDQIKSEDVVIIPAFGTTVEIEKNLVAKGVNIEKYNTTCPFVEKVWKTSDKLGDKDYTIIIHGKHNHEETRATFSHAKEKSPSIIVKDLSEAKFLAEFMLGNLSLVEFQIKFQDKFSSNFDPLKDLVRVGVVNQTTMLATETQAIADMMKETMKQKYGEDQFLDHFADTRDTLCYATNDNQDSTYVLLQEKADLAMVVGGYNSSNTQHIVELCEEKLPTYFISSAAEIISKDIIQHFDLHQNKVIETQNYFKNQDKITLLLTSGASCPDSILEEIIHKLLGFFEVQFDEDVLNKSLQAI